MERSESIAALAKGLMGFNGEIHRIEKDATNPFLKNTYASLDQIVDHVRPLLQKHGLSVMQFPSFNDGMVIVETILLHESGEYIKAEPLKMKPINKEKGGGLKESMDPQTIGSIITYARRYSLAAVLSLNTGEDDDGNAGSGVNAPRQQNKPPQQDQAPQKTSSEKKLSDPQLKKINASISELEKFGGTRDQIKDALVKKIGPFDSLKDLTVGQASKTIELLTGWIEQKNTAQG